MKRFRIGAAVVALLVLGYQWGLHVQTSANEAVMNRHLTDDSIDNETIWAICQIRKQEQPHE